jgi:hypothetical protein
MARRTRDIGPVGTAARVLVALALLYIAGGASRDSWGIEWDDAIIGLVALPALMVAVGLVARRYARGPIRFMGPLGIGVNLAVIVVLVSNEYTGGGATIFYGTTLLIAAWLGRAGCEATVISNLALGRDDQIGCPTLTPIDAAEAHLRRRLATEHARRSRVTRAMQGEPVMTSHEPPEPDTQHQGEPSNAFWGHSLAAAAVCLGTGAAVALIAILGQSW